MESNQNLKKFYHIYMSTVVLATCCIYVLLQQQRNSPTQRNNLQEIFTVTLPKATKEMKNLESARYLLMKSQVKCCILVILSLNAVVNKILEHWNSLKKNFEKAVLEDNLPSAKSVLNALHNSVYQIYLLFLSYVLELITRVNIELQSETPKLPLVLDQLTSLYRTLLKCFMKRTVLEKTSIKIIRLNDPSNYVKIEDLYVGAKIELLLKSDISITKEELHNFQLLALEYFIEICTQLKKRFNFEDRYLQYASNVTPAVAASGEVMSEAAFANLFPNIPIDIEAVNTERQLLSDVKICEGNKLGELNSYWEKVSEVKKSLNSYVSKLDDCYHNKFISTTLLSSSGEGVFSVIID